MQIDQSSRIFIKMNDYYISNIRQNIKNILNFVHIGYRIYSMSDVFIKPLLTDFRKYL